MLAGEISTVEVVAALVCSGLGTAVALGLITIARRRFRFRPAPDAVLRPWAALVPETFAVGQQLIAATIRLVDQRGGFVRQPFDPGETDDPTDAGRRAVAVLGISLAPRSFAVRGDRSDTMILHTLPERSASPDRRWPA